MRGRGRCGHGSRVQAARFSVLGTGAPQECGSDRDEGRRDRFAPKSPGALDRRLRDLVCCEPEHILEREPLRMRRSPSDESSVSELESDASDYHSGGSTVRASPRGVYVWEDVLCENNKALDRSAVTRGSTSARDRPSLRSPRASTPVPEPRASVRREPRASAVPSFRRSHRETRRQSRSTEEQEGRRSAVADRACTPTCRRSEGGEPESVATGRQSGRKSGVVEIARTSGRYTEETLKLS